LVAPASARGDACNRSVCTLKLSIRPMREPAHRSSICPPWAVKYVPARAFVTSPCRVTCAVIQSAPRPCGFPGIHQIHGSRGRTRDPETAWILH
jgi:hypothetical protein